MRIPEVEKAGNSILNECHSVSQNAQPLALLVGSPWQLG